MNQSPGSSRSSRERSPKAVYTTVTSESEGKGPPRRGISQPSGAPPPKRGRPAWWASPRELCGRIVHSCTVGSVLTTFNSGCSHEAFDQTSDLDRSGCDRSRSRGDGGGAPAHAGGERCSASP